MARLRRLSVLTGLPAERELLHRLETASSDAERHRIGVDHAARLGRAALAAGAPGLHLYTFNDHRGSLDVIEAVGLPGTRGAADTGLDLQPAAKPLGATV